MHHDKAAGYRREAQEIRAIVRHISINDAREHLLETAQHLDVLAEEEEHQAQQARSLPEIRSEP
jgi:hypothetical protein